MSIHRSNLEAHVPSGVAIGKEGELVLQNALSRGEGSGKKWFDIPIIRRGPDGKLFKVSKGHPFDRAALLLIVQTFKAMVDSLNRNSRRGPPDCPEFTCINKGSEITVAVTRLGKRDKDVTNLHPMQAAAVQIMQRLSSSPWKVGIGDAAPLLAQPLKEAKIKATPAKKPQPSTRRAASKPAYLSAAPAQPPKKASSSVRVTEVDSDEEEEIVAPSRSSPAVAATSIPATTKLPAPESALGAAPAKGPTPKPAAAAPGAEAAPARPPAAAPAKAARSEEKSNTSDEDSDTDDYSDLPPPAIAFPRGKAPVLPSFPLRQSPLPAEMAPADPRMTSIDEQTKRIHLMDQATLVYYRKSGNLLFKYSELANSKDPRNSRLLVWRQALRELLDNPKTTEQKAKNLKDWLQILYETALRYWMKKGSEDLSTIDLTKATREQKIQAASFLITDLDEEDRDITALRDELMSSK